MFSYLRNHFGMPGVIAVAALVFAMIGGAYAANGGGGADSKATASAKAKKGPRGPKGPKGDAGPQGPKGDTGTSGSNGSNGTNGTSPTGAAFAGEADGCKEGGVKFVGANTTVACNGVKGQTGFTKTLPSGETEIGTWSFGQTSSDAQQALSSISFVIPLSAAPIVQFINTAGEEAEDCPGTAAAPAAAKGVLCVYREPGAGTFLGAEASPGGATLFFSTPTKVEEGGEQVNIPTFAYGTWAVTAE
jgi:hypothetical protein